MKIQIKFVKEDCWIGVYWKSLVQFNCVRPDHGETGDDMCRRYKKVYICIVPCFPIIFETKGQWAPLKMPKFVSLESL